MPLKEHQDGARVDDLCRQLSISSGTFHNWCSKYAGMKINEAKRLRELESGNAKPSMLLDHEAGSLSEIDYINSAILRGVIQIGHSTPANETLTRLERIKERELIKNVR